MVNSNTIFILHCPVNGRQLFSHKLFSSENKIYVVVPPEMIGNVDSGLSVEYLPIGCYKPSKADEVPGVVIARNNIIDYALKNGIKTFWVIDDDFKGIRFEKGSLKEPLDIRKVEFPDDCSYGGLPLDFNVFDAYKKASYSHMKFDGFLFFNYNILPENWRYPEIFTWENIDMIARCYKEGFNCYRHNHYGFKTEVVSGKNGYTSLTGGTDFDKVRNEQFYKDHPEFCPDGLTLKEGKGNIRISFRNRAKLNEASKVKSKFKL